MKKPPNATQRADARIKFLNSILPRSSAAAQYSEARSPRKPTIPALPQHLDALVDVPWNADASKQIDLWIWYTQQEFELLGGTP